MIDLKKNSESVKELFENYTKEPFLSFILFSDIFVYLSPLKYFEKFCCVLYVLHEVDNKWET